MSESKSMTQKELVASLVDDVAILKLAVASLTDKVEKMGSIVPKEEPKPVEVAVPVPDYPIPAEYKDIVAVTFNKAFGVRLEPMKDTPAFLFTIVVPAQYSKVSSGEDLRVKVITYSDGVQGVRLWADKVWNNLDSDTQSKIVTDRPFVEAKI